MNLELSYVGVTGSGVVLAATAPWVLDYPGITGLITAVGVFIIGVGGFVVTAVMQLRRRVEATHDLVNSVAEAFKKQALILSAAEAEIARLKGKQSGIKAERKEPMVPGVVVGETVLEKETPKGKTKEIELTPARKAKLKAKVKKAK